MAGDAAGTLEQGETTRMAGTGAQANFCGGAACSRWGDYAARSIDPDGDCTFWFTTEYYEASGGNGQMRIRTFKFSTCGTGATPTASTTPTPSQTPTTTRTSTVPSARTPTPTATATRTATPTHPGTSHVASIGLYCLLVMVKRWPGVSVKGRRT